VAKANRKQEPSTRKNAGSYGGAENPDPEGVIRDIGVEEPHYTDLVGTMGRALGDVGNVTAYDPDRLPAEHKIYRRM
jgi:hypothetical protein